jgi:hypothetical protein
VVVYTGNRAQAFVEIKGITVLVLVAITFRIRLAPNTLARFTSILQCTRVPVVAHSPVVLSHFHTPFFRIATAEFTRIFRCRALDRLALAKPAVTGIVFRAGVSVITIPKIRLN